MRSIPLAMTWEMLRRGRWGLLAAALGANALTAIIFFALRIEGRVNPQDEYLILTHVILVQINMFIFGAAMFAAQGILSPMYALPLTTSSLVTWRLLPGMVLVALESAASIAWLNAAFGLGWPVLGPALFAAVALVVIQAAMWLTAKSGWQVVAVGFLTVALGIWFNSRYGATFSRPNRLWEELSPLDVASLLAIALFAFFIATVGVGRNRRGEPPFSVGILAWFERILDRAPVVGAPFQSPAQAQFWFEWRQKGWIMPCIVLFAMGMGFGIWLLFNRNPKELFEGCIAGGGLLAAAGLLGGILLGNSGRQDSDFELGHFLATRPMTNTDLSGTILKTAAKSVLIAWGIWAAASLALYTVLLLVQVEPQPVLMRSIRWWYFPATLLGAWTSVGVLASLGLTGRTKLLVQLSCGFFAMFIGLTYFSKNALSPPAQEQLWHGIISAIGIGSVLGTAWAFVAARRRALIGPTTLYIATVVWLALCGVVFLERSLHTVEPLPVYVLAVGLLALMVAPLATAPLALAWNRHR